MENKLINEVVTEIIQKVDEKILSSTKQWPVNSNRASELGHPCIRYLVFLRQKWQERPLPNLALLKRFKEGRIHEEATLRELTDAGIKVIQQQRAFSWQKYQITGSIDGKVVFNNKTYPLEIKSATEFSFNSINNVEDLLHHKYLYMRKYPAQLTLYLLMDDEEEGLFIFKNKSSGEFKLIPIQLDYDFGEKLIKRAEAINHHIAEETPTQEIPCIEYDENICGECDFIHLCLPEIKRDALQISDDSELVEMLTEWDGLKEVNRRYEQLDKVVKEKIKEVQRAVCGEYLITGEWISRKGFEVKESTYWKSKIQKLGKESKNGEQE